MYMYVKLLRRGVFMGKILSCILFSSLFTGMAFAYDINKVEVYPPYLSVGCSEIGKDSVGTLGISLNKLVAKESEDKIKISVQESLKVCELKINSDGLKSLAWKNVDPFKGYEVQYFDRSSSSLKTRTEIIDPSKQFNRFEAAVYLEDLKKSIKKNLVENEAIFEFNKLDLVNQNDLDLLNEGKDVKKTLVLFNTLNTTTIVNGEAMYFGDQIFSARNVTLTLTKSKNQFRVKSLEVK